MTVAVVVHGLGRPTGTVACVMQAEHKSGHTLVGCASRKLACGGSDQEALNDERVTNADGYGTAPEATVTTKDLAEPSGHHPNLSFAANVRYGHSRHFDRVRVMSACPPIATRERTCR
jgi:hypothetical protein